MFKGILTYMALFRATLLISLIIFMATMWFPLTDMHWFRQTQTAITTYWMLNGSDWIDYDTPVMGYPWKAPFEFPIYNWIVASLTKVLRTPLDMSGRIVSYAWLLLCLLPAKKLIDSYSLPKPTFLLFGAFLLASPMYLFWGRAFLMETQALFFGLAFLAAERQFVTSGRVTALLLAMLLGLVSALTKITTMLSFVLLAGLIFLIPLVERLRSRQPFILFSLAGVASVLVPVIGFSLWNRHADALKSQNAIAISIRSDDPTMLAFNFGPLSQRFSFDLAKALLRSGADLFGALAPLLLVVAVVMLVRRQWPDRRTGAIAGCLVVAFLAPFAVFTNLHIVHNYYQVANGVFLIAAVAVVLAAMVDRIGSRLSLGICILVLLSQYGWFATRFAPTIWRQPESAREVAIAKFIRAHTPRDSVVAIYGLEWTPLIPYYSQRRAVMEPGWTTRPQYRQRLANLFEPVGGLPMAAVVRCPSRIDLDPVATETFEALNTRATVTNIDGCAVYLPR
jgi:hypothetical protein